MSFRNFKDSLTLGTGKHVPTGVIPQKHVLRIIIKLSLPFLLISTSCIAFLAAASGMTVKPIQFRAPSTSNDDFFLPDVSLTAEAVSVDPMSRTIAMNWYPEFTAVNCSKPLVTDIYVPATLLDTSSPSWTTQMDDQPAFRMNSTEICLSPTSAYPSFRTVTKLIASKEYLRAHLLITQPTLQNYPYDVYLAPFTFYTRNVETGTITALKVSDSFGIATNFQISLLNSLIVQNEFRQNLEFILRVERAMGTKLFVILVAVVSWLTTIVLLVISALKCVYKPHSLAGEIFVVPLGTLFVLSSIRAHFPGAPNEFGITIDMYTTLPVFAIMSVSTFSLLLVMVYRRIHQGSIAQNEYGTERRGDNTKATHSPNFQPLEACPVE